MQKTQLIALSLAALFGDSLIGIDSKRLSAHAFQPLLPAFVMFNGHFFANAANLNYTAKRLLTRARVPTIRHGDDFNSWNNNKTHQEGNIAKNTFPKAGLLPIWNNFSALPRELIGQSEVDILKVLMAQRT